MGYGRTIVVGWTRRELLVVIVIAIMALFLTGTTVALSAMNAETAELAGKYDANSLVKHHESATAARETADADDIVLPVATVEGPSGQETLAVGIPASAPQTIPHASYPWAKATLPAPPNDGTLRGPVQTVDVRTFRTQSGDEQFRVTPPRDASMLSSDWYVTTPSTVRELGQSGALVVETRSLAADGSPPSAQGTALAAVILFLYRGTVGLVVTLSLIALGASLLVGVIVHNVTQISVRDRRRTIFVVRATGGTGRRLTGLFTLRSALITGVGLTLGIGSGVVIVEAIVGLVSQFGEHATLDPRVGSLSSGILFTTACALEFVGAAAGGIAAQSALNGPPVRTLNPLDGGQSLFTSRGGQVPATADAVAERIASAASLNLLTWRALVPTATTLTVFAVIAIFVLSVSTALAPLAGASNDTVVDSSAPHPLASEVSVERAEAIRTAGGNASPEILLTGVEDGQPYLVRGVNFTAYRAVTEASLTHGHPPRGPNQAIIGADLARTLGVDVGDTMTVGGSTVPRVKRVTVVGTYNGSGLIDDQLLVPLGTAREFTLVSPGYANLIRTENGSAAANHSSSEPAIVAATVPDRVAANDSVPVAVTVFNPASHAANRTVTVELDGQQNRTQVTVDPNARQTVTVRVPAGQPGEQRVRVGPYETTLTVTQENLTHLAGLPPVAPPGAKLRLQAQNSTGNPVRGATVSLGRRLTHSGPNGSVLLQTPDSPGEYLVYVDHGEATLKRSLTVRSGAQPLAAQMRVTPSVTTVTGRTTANITLYNPGDQQLTQEIVIRSESWARSRSVTLPPGERTSLEVTLPEAETEGTHTVEVVGANETVLANDTYSIPERSDAISASSAGAAVGNTVLRVTDNLWVLQSTMAVLAAGLVVGSTTVAFTQSVHARRRVIGIHRATGAGPSRILRLLVQDAARIGLVATIAALALAEGVLHLSLRAGLLTLFGVRIQPVLGPLTLAAVGAVGVSLSVLSAVLAARHYLSADPLRLLSLVPDRLDRRWSARSDPKTGVDDE